MEMIKKTSFVCAVLVPIFLISAMASIAGADWVPVPGPDWAGCPAVDSAVWQPLPRWKSDNNVEIEVTSPVLWPDIGTYDFCRYADKIYCGLQLVVSLAKEIGEFANLLQCLNMDINGPVDLDGDIPVSPNGMPDGQYELAILAHALNNPSNPWHAQATAAFQANFIYLREQIVTALSLTTAKDLRSIVNLLAPGLVSGLTCVLAGFATLGDPQTYDALDQLMKLLKDIGLEPPEGGIGSVTTGVPELGPFGDADGDGASNFMEYQYFVGELGYSDQEFIAAVFDPDQRLTPMLPSAKISAPAGYYQIGSNVTLTATLKDYYDMPTSIAWYHNGAVISGANELVLELLNVQEEDSGLYKIEVGVEYDLEEKELVADVISANFWITVSDTPLPVGSILGLALMTSACALAGAQVIRRRK